MVRRVHPGAHVGNQPALLPAEAGQARLDDRRVFEELVRNAGAHARRDDDRGHPWAEGVELGPRIVVFRDGRLRTDTRVAAPTDAEAVLPTLAPEVAA